MKMTNYTITGCAKIFSIVCLVSACQATAQFKNIEIPLAKFSYSYSGCEPSIDIHPSNENFIAVGSILDGYHYSTDGGETWKSKRLKSSYGVYGDPVLKFNSKGNLFYFHLASYSKTSHLDRIVCQRANKINESFNDGSAPKPNGKKVQDKHWVVIDSATNAIYMTWTQFDAYDSDNPMDSSIIVFSKSLDDGDTWTIPKRISKFGGDCLDGDNTVEGAMPSFGRNGELFVIWSGPKGLMMQVSMDKGQSWLEEELPLFEHQGGWDIKVEDFFRANGLPVFISDHTKKSPYYGNLYVNWSVQDDESGLTSVVFSRSLDDGTTWSEPVSVHKESNKYNHFLTWMTVDKSNGYLHFVYYRKSVKTKATDVVWAMSKDGGETFIEEVISERPFEPNAFVFFGDYLNIAALNNIVRPVWPRMDEGKISLWTALIKVE